MTDFREILRLNSLGLSNADVAEAVSCSRNTVSKVLKACSEKNIMWPLPNEINDSDLQALLFFGRASTTEAKNAGFRVHSQRASAHGRNQKVTMG